MTSTRLFSKHRARLLKQLQPDEALLLVSPPHALRNGDAEYRYRQSSDIYWLTGWTQPEVAVFIRPGKAPFTLFVQEKNPAREVWTGRRPGLEGAVDRFHADQAFAIEQLKDELPRLLQGVAKLHYSFAQCPKTDELLMASIHTAARAARKNGLKVPETFYALSRTLHELRLHKSPSEVVHLKEAARITALAHRAAMSAAKPGLNEHALEGLIDGLFRENGGNGPGYTTIVAGGENACILHYIENDQPLKDGDLVLIDAGCESSYYTADVTRTFPVNGRFSDAQREVYDWVLKAEEAAINAAQVGNTADEVHQTALRILVEGLIAMGLLSGNSEVLIHSQAYKAYFMHGTSHWLGLDVHDVGVYAREGKSRPLVEGMVLTVEPGLYIPANDTRAPEKYRGIGVRIEDDILITADGPLNLTADIPKSIQAVEAACEAAR